MITLFKKSNKNSKIAVLEISDTPEILYEKIKNDLTALEKEVYSKFKNKTRKSEWLSVRITLKEMLGEYFEIKYEKTGNPYIKNHLNISITHSKNIVGIILSKNKYIGIDIELLSPKILKTAHKFIEEEEIANFDEKDKIRKIYLNWCCKETLYKIKEHGGFDFKKDFKIIDSEIKKSGKKEAVVYLNNKTEHFFLSYEFIKLVEKELLLVWH